ncbi:MAG: DUF2318 domain-containing protein [Candidatus Anstonellaceae archaeon]
MNKTIFFIILLTIFFIVLIVLGNGFGIFGSFGSSNKFNLKKPSINFQNSIFKNSTLPNNFDLDKYIVIPLQEISTKAKWYNYSFSGKNIRFFVLKTSSGSIKAAFDACDVCYLSNKGYRQEGNFMVCNNCGNKFPIEQLGKENNLSGGCWPGYLKFRILGDYLLIEKSILEEGSWRFS